MTLDDVILFENLSNLVAYYKEDAHGIKTKLTVGLNSSREDEANARAYHDVDLQAFMDAGWEIKENDITVRWQYINYSFSIYQ